MEPLLKTGTINVQERLAKQEITPGLSLLEPKFDIREDFLVFYELLPVKIETLICPDEEYDQTKANEKRKSYFYWVDYLLEPADMARLYKAIICDFIDGGIRVKDFEVDTLRNIQAFGQTNTLFQEDAFLLLDFCRAVLTINNNFCERFKDSPEYQNLFAEEDAERQHSKFNELVKLVTKIFKLLSQKQYDQVISSLYRQNSSRVNMLISREQQSELRAQQMEELKKQQKEQRRQAIAERLALERQNAGGRSTKHKR